MMASEIIFSARLLWDRFAGNKEENCSLLHIRSAFVCDVDRYMANLAFGECHEPLNYSRIRTVACLAPIDRDGRDVT